MNQVTMEKAMFKQKLCKIFNLGLMNKRQSHGASALSKVFTNNRTSYVIREGA